MTSKERVLAVFNHRIPDRVPTYEVLVADTMVAEVVGIAGKDSWKLSASEMVTMARKMGFDAIIYPFVYKPREIFKNKIVDLDTLHFPEEWLQNRLEEFKQYMTACHENNLAIMPYTHGCFDLPYEVMGFEHYMLTLYDDYKYVKSVTDYFYTVCKRVVEEFVKLKPDAIFLADDLCYNNGLMIKEEYFMDLWYERENDLIQTSKRADIPVEYHTDGKLDPVLDYLIGMGIDVINPIDANCNDIYEIKERFGDRVALRGGINIAGALYNGTYAQVYTEAKEKLLRLKPNGNYIISSSHSVIPNIKYENYCAIKDALEQYGCY